MILLLLATPLDGAAERLAVLRMEPSDPPGWWGYTLPALSGITLAALGYSLLDLVGWGCLVMVGATIAFMIALHIEAAGHELEGRVWLAEPKAMAWLLLPFALSAHWVAGLAVLALYAAGSFFWVQHQLHGRKAAPPHD